MKHVVVHTVAPLDVLTTKSESASDSASASGVASASSEKEAAAYPTNLNSIQFLEALFTEQNANKCEELALLKSSTQ